MKLHNFHLKRLQVLCISTANLYRDIYTHPFLKVNGLFTGPLNVEISQ